MHKEIEDVFETAEHHRVRVTAHDFDYLGVQLWLSMTGPKRDAPGYCGNMASINAPCEVSHRLADALRRYSTGHEWPMMDQCRIRWDSSWWMPAWDDVCPERIITLNRTGEFTFHCAAWAREHLYRTQLTPDEAARILAPYDAMIAAMDATGDAQFAVEGDK